MNCAFNYLFFFLNHDFQTHKKVGGLWTEAGLNWRDFLPEDEDVNKFVTEQVSVGEGVQLF